MTTYLLDANVLIALSVAEHEHHDRASEWLARAADFAVCPVVEGALVRFLLRVGESAATAAALLERIRMHPRCQFWPDDISYRDIDVTSLTGHRQVTDFYLAKLAGEHGCRLATFDQALVTSQPTTTFLVP